MPRQKKKKNGPQERTDQSSGNNTTKRQRDSQPITTLVIRMLTELVEFGCKLDEKMKTMLRKENVQGTNSDRKETGTHINGVDQKEERNIQSEKNEETRI